MRSMVEGRARQRPAAPAAPSTSLRLVPLPTLRTGRIA